MIEIGIVPVLPRGSYEVVLGNLAPGLAAVLAEGYAAEELGLAREPEQRLDAACGFGLADQECGGDEGVAHGAMRRLVQIQPVAEGLVAVRGDVGPEVARNAQGAVYAYSPQTFLGHAPGRRWRQSRHDCRGADP